MNVPCFSAPARKATALTCVPTQSGTLASRKVPSKTKGTQTRILPSRSCLTPIWALDPFELSRDKLKPSF